MPALRERFPGDINITGPFPDIGVAGIMKRSAGERIKENPIIRKSAALLMKVPRNLRSICAKDADYRKCPPVLCNSFPKSGTHLLLQTLRAFPGINDYGTFISSMVSSLAFRQASSAGIKRRLFMTAPSEVVAAHIFYKHEYLEVLEKRNFIHYFIYRDLRDVAVSEAYYLTHMNTWHRLHKYFAGLPSMEERISLAILGGAAFGCPLDYPDIGSRFALYRGWLDEPSVFAVRYEELVSDEKGKTTREMALHFAGSMTCEIDVDTLAGKAARNIAPERSHTYREGKTGSWKEEYSDRHKDQIKKVAGELLIKLGYEKDHDW